MGVWIENFLDTGFNHYKCPPHDNRQRDEEEERERKQASKKEKNI